MREKGLLRRVDHAITDSAMRVVLKRFKKNNPNSGLPPFEKTITEIVKDVFRGDPPDLKSSDFPILNSRPQPSSCKADK